MLMVPREDVVALLRTAIAKGVSSSQGASHTFYSSLTWVELTFFSVVLHILTFLHIQKSAWDLSNIYLVFFFNCNFKVKDIFLGRVPQ